MTDGWESRLHNVRLVPIARQRVAWDQLQRSLEELSDEFQQFGDDVPGAEGNKLPKSSPDAAGELRALAEHVFTQLSCRRCGNKAQRDIRLKIGSYRKGLRCQGTKCLCLLLARDSPYHGWHEMLIHNTYDNSSMARYPQCNLTCEIELRLGQEGSGSRQNPHLTTQKGGIRQNLRLTNVFAASWRAGQPQYPIPFG